jgi:hypothetical protein
LCNQVALGCELLQRVNSFVQVRHVSVRSRAA